MASFEAFYDIYIAGLDQMTEEEWEDCRDACRKAGTAFAEQSRVKISRWTTQLESGALSKDDLEWLVGGLEDLADLEALKNAGLSAVRREKFRKSLMANTLKAITALAP